MSTVADNLATYCVVSHIAGYFLSCIVVMFDNTQSGLQDFSILKLRNIHLNLPIEMFLVQSERQFSVHTVFKFKKDTT